MNIFIDCNNYENILNNQNVEGLRELIIFFITKDGCETGLFNRFRNKRGVEIIMNEEGKMISIHFNTKSKKINFIDSFQIESLKKIAERTHYISGEQLELIQRYLSSGSRSDSELYLYTLYILLVEHLISKISTYKEAFDMSNSYKQMYFSNKKKINVDDYFQAYNQLCDHIYENMMEGGKKKKKTSSSLSQKTVDQLRSMMKKHGKKCSKDGKRLTKDQLIRVLKRC